MLRCRRAANVSPDLVQSILEPAVHLPRCIGRFVGEQIEIGQEVANLGDLGSPKRHDSEVSAWIPSNETLCSSSRTISAGVEKLDQLQSAAAQVCVDLVGVLQVREQREVGHDRRIDQLETRGVRPERVLRTPFEIGKVLARVEECAEVESIGKSLESKGGHG